MNTLQFTHAKGLFINDIQVPDTNNHHFEKLFKRIGDNKVNIILTNEIALNGNVSELGAMYGFRPSQRAAEVLLTHGNFRSGVYAFRLLGPLRNLTGKGVTQGTPPSTLKHGEIVVLVHANPANESGLDFMISYAAEDVSDV